MRSVLGFLLLCVSVAAPSLAQETVTTVTDNPGSGRPIEWRAITTPPVSTPKPWETDQYLVEDLCAYILDGEYDKFVALLTAKGLKLHEAWLAIDCSTIDEIGPTPAHTAVQTNFQLLNFTNDVLNLLKIERRAHHRLTGEILEVGHLFNVVKYDFEIPRTILDIVRLNHSRVSAQSVKDKLTRIELQLIDLGAKSARELGYENAR